MSNSKIHTLLTLFIFSMLSSMVSTSNSQSVPDKQYGDLKTHQTLTRDRQKGDEVHFTMGVKGVEQELQDSLTFIFQKRAGQYFPVSKSHHFNDYFSVKRKAAVGLPIASNIKKLSSEEKPEHFRPKLNFNSTYHSRRTSPILPWVLLLPGRLHASRADWEFIHPRITNEFIMRAENTTLNSIPATIERKPKFSYFLPKKLRKKNALAISTTRTERRHFLQDGRRWRVVNNEKEEAVEPLYTESLALQSENNDLRALEQTKEHVQGIVNVKSDFKLDKGLEPQTMRLDPPLRKWRSRITGNNGSLRGKRRSKRSQDSSYFSGEASVRDDSPRLDKLGNVITSDDTSHENQQNTNKNNPFYWKERSHLRHHHQRRPSHELESEGGLLELSEQTHAPLLKGIIEDESILARYPGQDDYISPTVSIVGVSGLAVELPCRVPHDELHDSPVLLLWYRDGNSKPVYSYDARNGVPASLWSATALSSPLHTRPHTSSPYTLPLPFLSTHHAGNYTCTAHYTTGPTLTASASLTVIEPPKLVWISSGASSEVATHSENRDVLDPLVEGDRLHLTCHVEGGSPPPTVTWWEGGTRLAIETWKRRTNEVDKIQTEEKVQRNGDNRDGSDGVKVTGEAAMDTVVRYKDKRTVFEESKNMTNVRIESKMQRVNDTSIKRERSVAYQNTSLLNDTSKIDRWMEKNNIMNDDHSDLIQGSEKTSSFFSLEKAAVEIPMSRNGLQDINVLEPESTFRNRNGTLELLIGKRLESMDILYENPHKRHHKSLSFQNRRSSNASTRISKNTLGRRIRSPNPTEIQRNFAKWTAVNIGSTGFYRQEDPTSVTPCPNMNPKLCKNGLERNVSMGEEEFLNEYFNTNRRRNVTLKSKIHNPTSRRDFRTNSDNITSASHHILRHSHKGMPKVSGSFLHSNVDYFSKFKKPTSGKFRTSDQHKELFTKVDEKDIKNSWKIPKKIRRSHIHSSSIRHISFLNPFGSPDEWTISAGNDPIRLGRVMSSAIQQGAQFSLSLEVDALTRRDHFRIFTCKVANSNLTDAVNKSFKVDMILNPRSLVLEDPSPNTPLVAEETRTFACTAKGAQPPVKLLWLLNGKPLDPSRTQATQTPLETFSSLSLPLQPDHNSANLTCTFQPQHVRLPPLREHLTLRVNYAPRVTLSPGRSVNLSSVQEGDDVYFECEVDASPSAAITRWQHQGAALKHSPGSGVIVSGGSLVLQGVGRRSGGRYTCSAANSQGEGCSDSLHLTVKYAPRCVDQNITERGASVGSRVVVSCALDALPPPSHVTWAFTSSSGHTALIDQAHVQHQDPLTTLVVFIPRNGLDFGELRCWGENSVGEQKEPCTFTVFPASKPQPPTNCSLIQTTAALLSVDCQTASDGGLKAVFFLEVWPSGAAPRSTKPEPRGTKGSQGYPIHAMVPTTEMDSISDNNPGKKGTVAEDDTAGGQDSKRFSVDKEMDSTAVNVSSAEPVFRVKGLSPGQDFVALLRACNEEGCSEDLRLPFSTLPDTVEKMTAAVKPAPNLAPAVTLSPLTTVLLAAVVGTLLTLTAVLVLAAVSLRRRRRENRAAQRCEDRGEDDFSREASTSGFREQKNNQSCERNSNEQTGSTNKYDSKRTTKGVSFHSKENLHESMTSEDIQLQAVSSKLPKKPSNHVSQSPQQQKDFKKVEGTKKRNSTAGASLAVIGYDTATYEDEAGPKYNTKVAGRSGGVEERKSGGVEDAGRGSYVELKLLGIDEERRKKSNALS